MEIIEFSIPCAFHASGPTWLLAYPWLHPLPFDITLDETLTLGIEGAVRKEGETTAKGVLEMEGYAESLSSFTSAIKEKKEIYVC